MLAKQSTKSYIDQIKSQLKEIDPYKIILFGSLSKNLESPDSDIDLLVVLDSDKISQTYREKMENKILVRKCIYNISKQIPIDLIVYTKKEYEIIKNNKNSFFKDIEKTGKILYEKAS
ncbi:MAG: nucleotidyltransferase domain-containing protein [Cyclobacteriaceae bacterium]